MKLFMAMVTLVLMTNTFAEEKKGAVGEQSATATTCKEILDSQKKKNTEVTPVVPVNKDTNVQSH